MTAKNFLITIIKGRLCNHETKIIQIRSLDLLSLKDLASLIKQKNPELDIYITQGLETLQVLHYNIVVGQTYSVVFRPAS